MQTRSVCCLQIGKIRNRKTHQTHIVCWGHRKSLKIFDFGASKIFDFRRLRFSSELKIFLHVTKSEIL